MTYLLFWRHCQREGPITQSSNFFLGYDPDPLIGFYPPLSATADPVRFIKWGFVIPSVLTNVILLYWVGRLIERLTIRFWVRRKSPE